MAKSKKSSGNSYTLLFIVILFAAVYLLFIRPRQQRLRQQQTAARQLQVGDEVVSAGGIHGTLVGMHDDLVEVEVAPGVVLTFLKRAVSARPGAAGSGGTTGTGSTSANPSSDSGSGSSAGAIPAASSDSTDGAGDTGNRGAGEHEAEPGEEDHPSGAGDAST